MAAANQTSRNVRGPGSLLVPAQGPGRLIKFDARARAPVLPEDSNLRRCSCPLLRSFWGFWTREVSAPINGDANAVLTTPDCTAKTH